MVEERLLTVRDVSLLLEISEKEVIDLAEEGKIPAYKVAGAYLRFKREQIEAYRKTLRPSSHKISGLSKYSFGDRLRDFFYFNDFYILSFLLILLLLMMIFRG
ncbi:MAG: helix-turn-helix domain-containing protein [Candidatus Omnitrophica bacterium]|nr:helix-turn-helix domain-containing protein [Candidatus Omnitrophota bacterium]